MEPFPRIPERKTEKFHLPYIPRSKLDPKNRLDPNSPIFSQDYLISKTYKPNIRSGTITLEPSSIEPLKKFTENKIFKTFHKPPKIKISKNLKRFTERPSQIFESWPNLHVSYHPSITWSSVSVAGSTFGIKKKFNQDAFTEIDSLLGQDIKVFAVFDGHGNSGHQISNFLSLSLKSTLELHLSKTPFPWQDPKQTIKSALTSTFHSLFTNLTKSKKIDSVFSGSTANIIIIHKDFCICGNIGDSRSVFGNFSNTHLTFIPLSKDHKPEVTEERLRIENLGGIIEPCKDSRGRPLGPNRVWIKGEKLPGLSMTRSIGDTIAFSIGIVPEAEIYEVGVGGCKQIVVVATDGLWEFVSSLEAVKVAAKHWGYPEKAAEDLLHMASGLWKQNSENVDDITIIVVYLSGVCSD